MLIIVQYEHELHSLRNRLSVLSEEKHRLEEDLSGIDAAHRLSQGQAAQLQVCKISSYYF